MSRRTFGRSLVLAILMVWGTALAQAAVVTVPAGLNPGDQYRLVFVTSASRDAMSSNIADYNTFVSNLALNVPELAALGTTWSAIGSTSSVNARDNTGTNPAVSSGVPIYRLDGDQVAVNNADLWDGGLLAGIDVTELGATVGNTVVWTGTGVSGAANAPLGSSNASNGTPPLVLPTPYLWITNYSPMASDELGLLYGMSGVLTVVPEPGSIVLGALGLCAVVGHRLSQRRRAARRA